MHERFDNRHTFTSDLGQSRLLHEIVPKTVTVRREQVRRRPRQTPAVTMFHEVNLIPAEKTWSAEVRALVDREIKQRKPGPARFASVVFTSFKQAIARAWDPGKFHVVLHSGGYDSRLVSVVIRELCQKHGRDWLGQVLFIEANGESGPFYEVMRREGWARSQYVVMNEKAPAGEYHAQSVQFRDAWRRLNGISRYPFNLWWDPVAWLQKRGLAPRGGLQCFTGYGANHSGDALKLGVGWWFRRDYGLGLASHPYICETVHPFYGLCFIETLMRHGGAITGNYRKLILEHIAPDIAAVAQPPTDARFRLLVLSDRLMRQVVKNYRGSWYGQKVRLDLGPQSSKIEYSEWWGAWCLASLCEHLRETGHTIEVET